MLGLGPLSYIWKLQVFETEVLSSKLMMCRGEHLTLPNVFYSSHAPDLSFPAFCQLTLALLTLRYKKLPPAGIEPLDPIHVYA